MYKPTIVEFGLLIGTLGIFFTAFLLFIRIFPVISISEVKSIMKTGDQHQHKRELSNEK
jgi:molybdopterin-containing oxidoreductase family membrane subunit